MICRPCSTLILSIASFCAVVQSASSLTFCLVAISASAVARMVAKYFVLAAMAHLASSFVTSLIVGTWLGGAALVSIPPPLSGSAAAIAGAVDKSRMAKMTFIPNPCSHSSRLVLFPASKRV